VTRNPLWQLWLGSLHHEATAVPVTLIPLSSFFPMSKHVWGGDHAGGLESSRNLICSVFIALPVVLSTEEAPHVSRTWQSALCLQSPFLPAPVWGQWFLAEAMLFLGAVLDSWRGPLLLVIERLASTGGTEWWVLAVRGKDGCDVNCPLNQKFEYGPGHLSVREKPSFINNYEPWINFILHIITQYSSCLFNRQWVF
jgi:hypothetical protein